MRRHCFVTVFFGVLLGNMSVQAAVEKPFTVIQLPQWREMEFEPHAMNDHGQVVGLVHDSAGKYNLLLWEQDKGYVDLGSAYPGQCDINNRGQICGDTTVEPNSPPQAFLREPDGTVVMLGDLGGDSSCAVAINERGQIVGNSFTGRTYRAFVWDRQNGMRQLPSLGTRTNRAMAISDSGQIFGYTQSMRDLQLEEHPCYWGPTDTSGYSLLAAPDKDFFSMNGRGEVVGKHFFMKDGLHVIGWQGQAGIRRLFPVESNEGLFERSTWKINDTGQVVCVAENRFDLSEPGETRDALPENDRYLWDPTQGKIPLDAYMPPQTVQFVLRDLNNRGCILGVAHQEDGGQVAMVLVSTSL